MTLLQSCQFDKAFLVDVPSRIFVSTDSTPFDPASYDMVCDYLNFLLNFSNVYKDLKPPEETTPGLLGSPVTLPIPGPNGRATSASKASSNEGQDKAGKYASSICKLSPDITICFWQIEARLALMSILKSEVQSRNAGLIVRIPFPLTLVRRLLIAPSPNRTTMSLSSAKLWCR